MRRGRRRLSLATGAAPVLLSALGLVACSSAPPASSSSRSASSPRTSPSSPPGVTPASPPVPAPPALGGCPPARDLGALPALARLPGDVDDLVVTDDGHIWVSSRFSLRIDELDGGGRLLRTIPDRGGPEGLAELPDGRIAVAEQAANRIAVLDRGSGRLSPLLVLPNPTGNEGVDGIAFDAAGGRLLVPDSPNGTLLSVALDGSPPVTLAGNLGRPASAAVLPDGGLVVATENPPGAVRVSAAGATSPLTQLGALDEVVVLGGLVYAADLGGDSVDAIDPRTGEVRKLVVGSPQPQGLAVTRDGRLLLADSTRREIVALDPCR